MGRERGRIGDGKGWTHSTSLSLSPVHYALAGGGGGSFQIFPKPNLRRGGPEKFGPAATAARVFSFAKKGDFEKRPD